MRSMVPASIDMELNPSRTSARSPWPEIVMKSREFEAVNGTASKRVQYGGNTLDQLWPNRQEFGTPAWYQLKNSRFERTRWTVTGRLCMLLGPASTERP
jgi:hypothetical protein